MTRKKEIRTHLSSSVLPALLFGAVSGGAAGAAVTLYKLCAKGTVALSDRFFHGLREQLWLAIPFLLLALPIAFLLYSLYKKEPDLQGGGIPASVGTLRGLFSFRPWKNAFGSFFLSLIAFLFGIPLGTEGPSVQLGTALGAGICRSSPKRWRAWERYAMTGGASAGFAVATGAPISGIFFAIEEAHGRISPLIILTAVTAVLGALLVTHLLSPLLGVEVELFDLHEMEALPVEKLWIPLLVGVAMGLFSLLFLRGYRLLDRLLREKWRAPNWVKIFAIFCLTLPAGFLSAHFISTGHHLIGEYFEAAPSLWMLLAILAVRSLLTLSANTVGITGGIFLPLLAIGSTLGLICYRALGAFAEGLLPAFVVFGIAGCIAGMMKMPLTAVIFGVEALGLSENLLPLILICIFSYAVPEAFGEESVGEKALERRAKTLRQGKRFAEEETEIPVTKGAFAVGKEIRDIFWPNGVRVLSVRKAEKDSHLIGAGDVLTVQIATFDREKALEELSHICTKQETRKQA